MKIIRNRARCKRCGDIIESTYRHEFKPCKCGAIAVDGGHDYLRRSGNTEDIEEMNEVEPAPWPIECALEEGHNLGAYYWIMPVSADEEAEHIFYREVFECREAQISISEQFVNYFMIDILQNRFDRELDVNKKRITTDFGEPRQLLGFYRWMHHNFYSYSDMQLVLSDMATVADLLRSGNLDALPQEMAENYKRGLEDKYFIDPDLDMENRKALVAETMMKVIGRVQKMMDENPGYSLISVMAP